MAVATASGWPDLGLLGASIASTGSSDVACDVGGGEGLEGEVVDEDVFVDAVFGGEVAERVGVAERDEAVGDAAVGGSHRVAVAVAVAERGHEVGIGVVVAQE